MVFDASGKIRIKRLNEALLSASVVLVVFLGVLFAKGIFPFGELRIDYYDMGQTNAPLYYHIWDFLHGRGGLFYSWYIDEGQNLSMGSSIQWNISVFNLFFLFIKRSAVMKSLSIFMGIHLFFMAFNMNLFLRHTIEAPKFYRILFSIAYGMTGFTLTHYTIPTYLDTAALMPLYLITLHDVLVKNKNDEDAGMGEANASNKSGFWSRFAVYIKPVTLYTLMTGYMTGLGYYMAFMNLIFVLLVSGTYIFVLCGAEISDKAERIRVRGRAAARLGIGTFGGIGLSAFILLPAAMQMMQSSRFNSNLSGGLFDTLHEILWAIGADMYYIKWWLLSGSIAAIVILVCGMAHFRKEIRELVFFFLFCMYPCALIVFESINLLWHMGTYYHYPVRCGYLVPIVLLTTGAYYAGRFEREAAERDGKNNERKIDAAGADNKTGQQENNEVNKDDDRKAFAESYVNYNKRFLIVVDIVSMIVGMALILYYTKHDVWEIEELFRVWVIFALALGGIYFLILVVLKRPAYIAPVLIMELAVTAFIGYGQPHFTDKYSSDPEQSGDYVVTAQRLADGLDIAESRTDRIKNPDTTLNTNYGFIMRRATAGGWANTVSRPQMDSAIALGYGAHFMRILDAGGTLLSDAMLHVTETVTLEPMLYTDEAWEKEGEMENYALLLNKYTLPFVMKAADERMSPEVSVYKISQMNIDDATNTIYHWLAAGTELDDSNIMIDITDEVRNEEYYVNSKKALYLREGSFDSLTINGETIPVPDIGDAYGTSYPAWFNSGLLYLGIYEDQEIDIQGADDPQTRFYELDIDKLEAICDYYAGDKQEIKTGRSSVDIEVSAKAGQMALIPMAYDSGFKATVNGEKADIINAADLFMEIPLKEGVNNIRLSFTPRGLVPGIIISLIFLGLVILFTLRPVKTERIYAGSYYLLALIWGAFVIGLYLIPYIAFLIHQIQKRLL
ncbi:MAG: YfhO family protein [Lachnospiraceae bacterium]|nr:YfhO family protein [Lachnospiraceae bacterium]